MQGVVTYMPPIQVFAIVIKAFDRQKVCLIAWSFPSEALECLIFKRSKVELQPCVLDPLIIAVFDPLIGPQEGLWSLD